jgi:hypothetical protein
MNRRLSHILAMTLVATALCADRAVASSAERVATVTENRSLVGRLSTGLRRTVTPVQFIAERQAGRPVSPVSHPVETPVMPPVRVTPVTPAQFPLPPPLV